MKPSSPALALFAAVGAASGGFALAAQTPAPPAEPTPEQATFFETKVRPVLAKECYGCHGPTAQQAGVRLDVRGGADRAIVAGDPEKSPLILAVRYAGGVKMPPAHKLKPEEIGNLEAWVRMGAPWPKGAPATRRQDLPLWSLKPVAKPAVPKVAGTTNPIDAFVRTRLAAKGLKPSPPAERRALLRRVAFDLTGLPPTPAETDAFLADKSPTAYERLVDRLLASPRYGERWARMWMDVARYADNKGYTFGEDREYPDAYTYRTWVIRALNADLPYDRFVTAQLAADRLPRRRATTRRSWRRSASSPSDGGSSTNPRYHRRPDRRDDARPPGLHRRLRPVPRPQVRPHPDPGLLLALRRLRLDRGAARAHLAAQRARSVAPLQRGDLRQAGGVPRPADGADQGPASQGRGEGRAPGSGRGRLPQRGPNGEAHARLRPVGPDGADGPPARGRGGGEGRAAEP